MLSYEFTKQLKDANFPLDWYLHEEPNLWQIIEACGNKFQALVLLRNDKWRALSIGDIASEECKTPEDAVAELWLKLYESDTKNKE